MHGHEKGTKMDHSTNVGGRFMLYIGIDLGTSAVKLLLMDSEGNIRNIVSREYPLYFPHPGLVGTEAGGLV